MNEVINHSVDQFVAAVDWSEHGGPTAAHQLDMAWMAAFPGHPLLSKMIDHVMFNVNNRLYGEGVLDITGPKALLKAFNKYMELNENAPLSWGTYQKEDSGQKIVINLNFYNDFHTHDDDYFVTKDAR